MEIIAHRGYWRTSKEKNSQIAFTKALENGWGIETDIRDCNEELVISHDIPSGNEMRAEEFFKLYSSYECKPTLALNIKADGLQSKLKALLLQYKIENYFVFDMSIPDTLGYISNGLKIFSRTSEYEKDMPFYANSPGVWMDCFNSDCISNVDIEQHQKNNKRVCIVSSELHKREHLKAWSQYKKLETGNILICTDYPQEAEEYFNGKN